MLYYEIVTIKNGDEFTEFEGIDRDAAIEAKEKTLHNFNKYLTDAEKTRQSVECRVYNIPDETDISDPFEISNALNMCCGYDLF